ncbi:hypothetical protein TcasGA2_TC001692 [Tribolium castaneum]|uniref:CCHC-type domain-containing protein n=1 Tax=Tribolium castaneum TaxID=7070 RepID=D6W8G0_TRICA|nr:hypothetical protein TcasGA2_TC001692 [Tribolium castaneum]
MAASPSSASFPDQEQAIVLLAVEGLKLIDYVKAIGGTVQPKNIIFASRIANHRICIYLKEVPLVDKIVSEHSTVLINDTVVSIRRLINPAKRIIISNVCPAVPHSVLENLIQTMGFTLASKMSCLRAGIQDDEYSHVLSYRRQIYVNPNDNIDFSPYVFLEFKNVNYKVFLSYDGVCYKCKETGHHAAECPNENPQVNDSANIQQTLLPTAILVTSVQATPPQVTQQMHKRQLSEDNDEDNPLNLSLSSMFETDSGTSQRENIHDFKRQKTNSMESVLSDVSNLLSPSKDLLDNCESYPLSFSQMVDFFNRSSRKHDIAVLVQTFTSDISGLLDQFYDVSTTPR